MYFVLSRLTLFVLAGGLVYWALETNYAATRARLVYHRNLEAQRRLAVGYLNRASACRAKAAGFACALVLWALLWLCSR